MHFPFSSPSLFFSPQHIVKEEQSDRSLRMGSAPSPQLSVAPSLPSPPLAIVLQSASVALAPAAGPVQAAGKRGGRPWGAYPSFTAIAKAVSAHLEQDGRSLRDDPACALGNSGCSFFCSQRGGDGGCLWEVSCQAEAYPDGQRWVVDEEGCHWHHGAKCFPAERAKAPSPSKEPGYQATSSSSSSNSNSDSDSRSKTCSNPSIDQHPQSDTRKLRVPRVGDRFGDRESARTETYNVVKGVVGVGVGYKNRKTIVLGCNKHAHSCKYRINFEADQGWIAISKSSNLVHDHPTAPSLSAASESGRYRAVQLSRQQGRPGPSRIKNSSDKNARNASKGHRGSPTLGASSSASKAAPSSSHLATSSHRRTNALKHKPIAEGGFDCSKRLPKHFIESIELSDDEDIAGLPLPHTPPVRHTQNHVIHSPATPREMSARQAPSSSSASFASSAELRSFLNALIPAFADFGDRFHGTFEAVGVYSVELLRLVAEEQGESWAALLEALEKAEPAVPPVPRALFKSYMTKVSSQ